MNGNITGWKNMPIEDKILLVMEVICFILTAGTLGALVFAITKGFILGIIILVLSIFGFIGCGLSARSSRDTFIREFRLESKFNIKKISKLLKWN
jgi:hypothetical protein